MSMRFTRNDFQEVPGVSGVYYCPGCNATTDDWGMPSVHCPCARFGTGQGSLTQIGVENYLSYATRLDNYLSTST